MFVRGNQSVRGVETWKGPPRWWIAKQNSMPKNGDVGRSSCRCAEETLKRCWRGEDRNASAEEAWKERLET